ncbi:hypothetical protein EJ02DRAFT_414182 [Clathrospora elynae]|uniref:DUF7703 domain-containing protein n=1 Tax=Clathrospora elynae TaxID=706981 RepID=A0A6A5S8Z5_9PLEO|nr:hypothetical protein EJ02DRAFT_414182 [Clathrospora elynae]
MTDTTTSGTTAGRKIAAGATNTVMPLPTAMAAAAFVGIAWYLCAELSVRLLIRCTRRSLYFWACLVCCWAIAIHCVAITLNNFYVWTHYSSIVVIHLMWFTYVVSQSIVLYSRLNLVMKKSHVNRYVLYMISINAVVFGLTTVVLGMVARYPKNIANLKLDKANLIWDKVELAAFFIQETIIGLLYIRATSAHLKNMTLLGRDRHTTRRDLRHLIEVNVFIIVLDAALIGVCYTGFFNLQGFFKAAIYAIKLRTEFTILNQLRSSLHGGSYHRSADVVTVVRDQPRQDQHARRHESEDSNMEMVVMADHAGKIRVRSDIVVSTNRVEKGDSSGDFLRA